MPEKMYCPKCKKDVEPEILEWDGIVEFCPICRTGYREVSYEAHMRELEDEHAILSEFENETHPYLSRHLTKRPADDGDSCPVCGTWWRGKDACDECGHIRHRR